jgi:hypothetical protein
LIAREFNFSRERLGAPHSTSLRAASVAPYRRRC